VVREIDAMGKQFGKLAKIGKKHNNRFEIGENDKKAEI